MTPVPSSIRDSIVTQTAGTITVRFAWQINQANRGMSKNSDRKNDKFRKQTNRHRQGKTAPAVKSTAKSITSRCYENCLCMKRPELIDGFENTGLDCPWHGQARSWPPLVYAYFCHSYLTASKELASAVERLLNKHVEARICPSKLPHRRQLLEAMKDVLENCYRSSYSMPAAYNASQTISFEAEPKLYQEK